MQRITSLASVALFAVIGVPLAVQADHHETGEKANDRSNAQWSEDAQKGQERAAEVKAGAKHDAKKAEHDAKAKADKMTGDAKATAHKTKHHAKATGDKAKGDAKAKADAAAANATGKAKGAVDAAVPGLDAGADAEAGAGAK